LIEFTKLIRGPIVRRWHGSPYDRGAADSFYGRPRRPHYSRPVGGGMSRLISVYEMTEQEIKEYNAGYADNNVNWNYK